MTLRCLGLDPCGHVMRYNDGLTRTSTCQVRCLAILMYTYCLVTIIDYGETSDLMGQRLLAQVCSATICRTTHILCVYYAPYYQTTRVYEGTSRVVLGL